VAVEDAILLTYRAFAGDSCLTGRLTVKMTPLFPPALGRQAVGIHLAALL
jgi:hypothetical protein